MIIECVEGSFGLATANQYGTTGDESVTMYDGSKTTHKGVIFALHGRSLYCNTWGPITAGSAYEHVRALMWAGYVVISIDCGGPFSWSNPACLTILNTAIPIALTRFGGSRVGLLGFSMGGFISLNYLKRHPSLVSGMFAFSALTDLSFEYTPSGYTPAYATDGDVAISTAQSEINTAFGCTTANYASVTAGYRVYDEYSTWQSLKPIRLCHADNDTTVPVDQAKAFIAGVNDPSVTLRETATGGHGNFVQVNTGETVSFFSGLSYS